jgi:outer membrane biosynthesis protein TonB
MKASLFLAASGAVMAMAGPINKRVMETEWVMEVVTVTVTSGAQATAKANSDAVFIDPPAPTTKLPDVPVEQAPVVENPVVEAPRRPTTTVRGPPPRPTTKAPEPAPQPTKAPEPAPKPTTQQPSQPAPSAPSAPSGSDYKSTVLYQHNIHRANHSAPDLTWDDTLAGYAENTARGCVFQHDMYVEIGLFSQRRRIVC